MNRPPWPRGRSRGRSGFLVRLADRAGGPSPKEPRGRGTTTMYRARLGIRPGIWLSIAVLLAAAGAASPAWALDADNPGSSGWGLLNLPYGVTSISREVYGLHMMAFWVCIVI